MSAKDKMRSMLDELMGTNRDGESKDRTVTFDSRVVCKSYLLECCPHEILSGTRMDLGECMYVHDPALKADYRQESLKKDFYFEIDALSHLESFIGDCDRRVEAAKMKLSDTQEELSEEAQIKADQINNLGEQIGTKLAKAETLGTQGEVNESLKLMQEVEKLREEKATAENDLKNIIPVTTYQQQKLRVCEACSAYLGIHDNDRRLADHFGGKLHAGFIQIRQKLDELRKYVDTNDIMAKARLAMIQDGSRRDREYDSGGYRDRERDRDRDRPSLITRGGEYRERSRDRRRRSSRSRSRSSRSRSRSSRSSHHKKHKKHKKHHKHR